MTALPWIILLCVVLPFVVSFIVDALLLTARKGRAGVRWLIVAVAASVVVAGLGVLLLQLHQMLFEPDPAAAARYADLGGRLLVLSVPLAVVATLVRLWVAGLRMRAERKRDHG